MCALCALLLGDVHQHSYAMSLLQTSAAEVHLRRLALRSAQSGYPVVGAREIMRAYSAQQVYLNSGELPMCAGLMLTSSEHAGWTCLTHKKSGNADNAEDTSSTRLTKHSAAIRQEPASTRWLLQRAQQSVSRRPHRQKPIRTTYCCAPLCPRAPCAAVFGTAAICRCPKTPLHAASRQHVASRPSREPCWRHENPTLPPA